MTVTALPNRIAACGVVRVLASDERAELLLLHGPDGPRRVAKVFRSEVRRQEIDRELAALARVAHPHVIGLLDAETAPDGRVVALLPRLDRGSLADWLAHRDRLSVGEAITVLVPVASAVRALHARGVAHGRLGPDRILLDASGAPVVVGLGGAALVAPALPQVALERVPEVMADLAALRSLAEIVLARVAGQGARAAAEVRARAGTAEPFEIGDVLTEGLFAFAAGSPLQHADTASVDASPERAPLREAPHHAPAVPHRGIVGRLGGLLERGPTEVVRDRIASVWAAMAPGRRRMVVGVLSAGAAAALAVLLVPTSGGAPARAGTAPSHGPVRATPRAPGGVSAAGDPRSSTRTGEAAETAVGAGDAATIHGDDAAAALPVLLRTRGRCFRDQDASCLRAVDEAGSPAWRSDAALIDRPPASGARSPEPTEAHVVEELGAAVIVEAGDPPADWLLVRLGSDGWRIRGLPETPRER